MAFTGIKFISVDKEFYCGCCGGYLGNQSELKKPSNVPNRLLYPSFCPYCGMEISWDDQRETRKDYSYIYRRDSERMENCESEIKEEK